MADCRNLDKTAEELRARKINTVKTTLSVDTRKLVQQSRWHHDKVPYTKLRDMVCTFKITYVTYYEKTFIAHGVIWPYKEPEKAANFLYRVVGPAAIWNISDIMECCNSKFRQERDVYRADKLEYPEQRLQYPYWAGGPIRNMLVDEEFTVKAYHYCGRLQLLFGTYKFQKEIDKLEREAKLNVK